MGMLNTLMIKKQLNMFQVLKSKINTYKNCKIKKRQQKYIVKKKKTNKINC